MVKTKESSSSSSSSWKTFGVRLPPELAKAIRVLAAKNEKKVQDIMMEALQDVLVKYGEKTPKG
ncbi:MAG TPA: ribbon-helix-helix domain-containing protein [Nitrospirota bacterium]|nr:ribbon-helix-helix domain-containing protein [Nitrospirota bacterium]